MKRSDHQHKFMCDFMLLLAFIIHVKGYKVTATWLGRNKQVQAALVEKGLSRTMNSKHLKNQAVDLNIFIDGKFIQEKGPLEEIGVYWENLDPLNRWGGNFTGYGINGDYGHFERNS